MDDGKAGSGPEMLYKGEHPAASPREGQDLGAWVRAVHPRRAFSQRRREGKPGSSGKKVIELMNVCKKNYVYRHLSVNTRIYSSPGKILDVASWWLIVTMQVNKM